MKKITRMISALLCTTLLASVVTVAPLSVSAADKQDVERDSAVYESNVEKVERTTSVTDFNDNKKEPAVDDVVISEPEPTERIVIQSKKSVDAVGASFTVKGFTYKVTDKEATITKYNDSSISNLEIPEKLGGYPVVAIAGGVFKNFSNLASISVPNSIRIIGNEAFYNTPWYNSQPDGMVYLGSVAYKYKGANFMPQNTVITLQENTLSVSPYAFYKCTNLQHIFFPNSVVEIGAYSFMECSSLINVNIPDSVTAINNDAFYGCVSLEHVILSAKLEKLSYAAFRNCTSLTEITIPKTLKAIPHNSGVRIAQ